MQTTLVEKNHGVTDIIFKGNSVSEVVDYLKKNENIINWIRDEDPEAELPDLEAVEDLSDLIAELKKIDLGWWALEVTGTAWDSEIGD